MSETALRRRIRAVPSLNDPATMRFVLETPVQPGRSANWTARTAMRHLRALCSTCPMCGRCMWPRRPLP